MYQAYVKRVLDIVIAILAILALSVPLMLVALWIKLDSRGPVLFRQLRSGKNGVPFVVYKFRTMTVDAPSDSPTNLFKDAESYITRLGKIMRKLSIDELPQLLNVLKGDMSTVGPRPVVLNDKKLLKEREKYGVKNVKPGITGWAQVNGRDELDDKTKATYDAYYVNNLGIKIDLICIVKTIWTVIAIKGHAEGHEQVNNNENPIFNDIQQGEPSS